MLIRLLTPEEGPVKPFLSLVFVTTALVAISAGPAVVRVLKALVAGLGGG